MAKSLFITLLGIGIIVFSILNGIPGDELLLGPVGAIITWLGTRG